MKLEDCFANVPGPVFGRTRPSWHHDCHRAGDMFEVLARHPSVSPDGGARCRRPACRRAFSKIEDHVVDGGRLGLYGRRRWRRE